MLTNMVLRKSFLDKPEFQNELSKLRDDINQIDEELINLLANRMKISRKIGGYKKKNNITILQKRRWDQIIKRSKAQAAKVGLSQKFIMDFINAIHLESIDQQQQVFKEKE